MGDIGRPITRRVYERPDEDDMPVPEIVPEPAREPEKVPA